MTDEPNRARLDYRPQSRTERHLQTIVMFILLGVISWVGITLQTLLTSMNEVTSNVMLMKSQIARNTIRLDNYPTPGEMDFRFEIVKNDITQLNYRVEVLENRRHR